ncbi:helix-turn-helix domain-containing protein [Roseibium sp. HPY-6]|uniref:helix-turn-helix domain-containing protein n=1 Tax=Roseibium sp. HPY-6 TaxID=3229852 RepID=UPI00338F0A4F
MIELKAFGELVRTRRKSARLSQEALAAVALGNGNRKGYISIVENGRVTGLKPETAQRLAEALDIDRQDVPASLRWPIAEAANVGNTLAQEALDERMDALLPLVRFVEEQRRLIQQRVEVHPIDAYKTRLRHILSRLSQTYGDSFSFRSFAMSLSIAYVYLFFAGLLAFSNAGGRIGALEIFRRPGWANDVGQAMPAVLVALLVVGVTVCGYFWCRKSADDELARPSAPIFRRLWRIRRVRIVVGAVVLGFAAVGFTHLGVDPVFATIVIAIFALTALSDLGPRRCAVAGAFAGALVGLVESLVIHRDIAGGLEGALFGGILGSASFYVSAKIAARAPSRLIGGFSGAGVGVCAGALATTAFFAAIDLMAVNHALDTRFAIQSFDFLATQDRTYVVLCVTWLLLPLVNASLDYVSYSVSKRLAQRAVKGETTLSDVAWLSALDVAIAMLLSAMTVAAVFGSLWIADQVFSVSVSPHTFLGDWWSDPFGAGIWLSLMIASTLSWSILHYFGVVVPIASAKLASAPRFARLKERVLRDVSSPVFGVQTFALSFVPKLMFVFAFLAFFSLSLFVAWFALSIGLAPTTSGA